MVGKVGLLLLTAGIYTLHGPCETPYNKYHFSARDCMQQAVFLEQHIQTRNGATGVSLQILLFACR